MRFHCLALPHTITSHKYSACAFTQKVLKFCSMMHARGHTVFHYGHQKSEVECTENIGVMNDAILEETYGNYDWHTNQFKHDSADMAHVHFNREASKEISKRKQRGDFLLLFWGMGHLSCANDHPDLFIVEPGIGSYNQPCARFSIYESYSVMSYILGKYNMFPRFMDAVVPNYFDERDFIDTTTNSNLNIFIERSKSDKIKDILACNNYVLMIARLITTKGISLAIDVCKMASVKLVIVGQGSIKDFTSEETRPEDPLGVTHLGYVEPNERAILIARSRCLICPTLYNEPFGGVNVEAQISGIPVISTDWGGFAETIVHGVTGYRCRTMDHFIWALNNVQYLDKTRIRNWAINNYGFNKIAEMYEEFFGMVSTVSRGGFYEENSGRTDLKWLEKTL